MTDKLYELASDMEANKPVNNPGNWNLVQAAADRLESLQAELNELKTHPQVLTLMARIEKLEADNERLKDIEKSLREVIANREEELDGAVQLIREKQSKLDRVIEFVKPYAKADGGYVWAAKILDLLK